MSTPGEDMFFFDGGGGRRLLGFLHLPPKGKASRAAVYCHPFAEEKNQSHAVIAGTARRLAASGTAVLRFDLSGCGDSEGDLEDASADAWLEEIGRAAELLRERSGAEKLGVWGLRAGANLAALFAAGRKDIAFGMFWQPVPDLKTYMHQFLRQKLATEMAGGMAGGASGADGADRVGTDGAAPGGKTEGLSVKTLVKCLEAGETVEVMGYPITRGLYDSLASRSKPFAGFEFPFPACLVAVSEGDSPSPALKRMADGLSATNRPVPLLHVRDTTFWDRYWRWDAPSLAGATAEWLAAAA